MSEIIIAGVYLLGFAVSAAVLAPWLFKTKNAQLENSKVAALVLASAVSIAWPAAMVFFFWYRNDQGCQTRS